MKFPIAEKLTLPENAVTQTFGFFGRKGSGKTYAAGVLAESFLSADVQVVVLDPVGNWFGLRLSKTGKSESPFHIPILGGERGDIPLQTTGGALVAQTIVETGTSTVLDVSSFRKAERKRFMADFAEELFHRKKTNRSPMHLVIEEAQLFAPQMAKGEERMLGAIEDLVRLGRNYGIGCSMISQRPQSINTEVRNQCEPLVVFQLVAHHEREAIAKWMEHMGVSAELADLSKLKTGECFFWSPAWLEKFVRTRFNEKQSFDASSTPTAGSHQKSPARLKSLDLGKLQMAMAATIEQAKANDPAELKKKISDLERQLKAKAPAAVDQASIDRAVAAAVSERDRHWKAEVAKLQTSHGGMVGRLTKINQLSTLNGEATVSVAQPADIPVHILEHKRHSVFTNTSQRSAAPAVAPRAQNYAKRETQAIEVGDVKIGKAERAVLRAFYWTRDEGVTPSKLAFYADYSVTSSTFGNACSTLRKAGLIEGWQITDSGVAYAATYAGEKPAGPDLREWLRKKLGRAENALMDVLIDAGGDRVTYEVLSERTGYQTTSSTFGNALSTLRTLTAAEGGQREGGVKASPVFFEE